MNLSRALMTSSEFQQIHGKTTEKKGNKVKTLEFKWTVSKGRDTYGYNICTLYVDGRRAARCNGGGYDMKGTCLGNFIASAFADRLRALTPAQMPHQSHWEGNTQRVCDGKCKDDYRNAVMQDVANGGTGDGLELMKLADDCFECPKCGGATIQSRDGKTVDDGHYFYGLTFHDPDYNPGKAVIGKDCSDRTFSGKSEGKTVEQAEQDGDTVGLERYQAFYSASSKVPTERHTVPLIDGACGFSSVTQIMEAIGLSLEWVKVRSSKLELYRLHDKAEAKAA